MTAEAPESGSDPAAAEGAAAEVAPEVVLPRLELRDPLPQVVDTPAALTHAAERIGAGTGPLALDAERASGYRYSQRAYLLQVRREGSDSHLIDPIAFDDHSELSAAFGDAEWILHAASQDLPCLAEIGLRPTSLFDTELAGRLLNLPRVGLASLVEHYLGLSLAKEFSAADWSTRPLPDPWLVYAALDVEVLVELRNLIDDELTAAGKRGWAAEEFEALLSFTGPPVRIDPWRRTSGMHKARGRRALALVRELWQTRDTIAEGRDITPGRILPDAALVDIAMTAPKTVADLKAMRAMRNRGPRRFLSEWFDAVERGLALPDDELPTTGLRTDGPPPPRAWGDKNPEAAARLASCRTVVVALSEQSNLPAENLISPQLVRNLAWEPPTSDGTAAVTEGAVVDALEEQGARRWQVGLIAGQLADALSD